MEGDENRSDPEMGLCPHCHQFMLDMTPDNPAFGNYVFSLMKKAGMESAEKARLEEKRKTNCFITFADTLTIRDYFEGLKDEAQFAETKEDLEEVKKKLGYAVLRSDDKRLHKLLCYKRDEVLLFANFRLQQMACMDEGFTEEELEPGSEFSAKKDKVLSIIRKLSERDGEFFSVPADSILHKCSEEGIKLGDVMRIIERLKREGEIFEPMRNLIQLI